jgi:heme exporter protein D
MLEVIYNFLHMGGYALYVWLSYGVALLVMSANILVSWWQRRYVMQLLSRVEQHANFQVSEEEHASYS